MSIRQGSTVIAGSAPVKSIPIIGEIKKVCGTSNYIPEGCVLCNGTEFRGDQFSDLWTNFLTSTPAKLNVCSYAEYDNQVNTYGFCNSFAVDTIHQTFKVPTRNSYRKLVKKYVNGSDWYNLYDDGWIEQGGISTYTSDATYTVGLFRAMSNTNYTVLVTVSPLSSGYTGTVGADRLSAFNLTTTSFGLRGDTSTTMQRHSWEVKGYTSVPNTTANIDREFVCIVNGFVNQSSFDWGTWQNGLNSKLNVNLSNSKNISNCITEIPQDIKLELNNGTLTLKAGSKVYVPNGSGVFDVVTIASDLGVTRSSNKKEIYVYRTTDNSFSMWENHYSGSTAPTGQTYMLWYDTSANKVKATSDGGSTWSEGFSLPVGFATSNTTQITDINQVFNGFGYIGSTVFALPGVKGLIPNGRNADGSLKNIEYSVSSPITGYVPAYTAHYLLGNTGVLNPAYYTNYIVSDEKPDITNGDWYDTKNNYIHKIESGEIVSVNNAFDIGMFFSENSRFIGCNSRTAFHTLDYNDKGTIAGFAMPSGNYITLTTGSSGSTYTAPANGWFCLGGTSTSSGGNLALNGSGGMCCQSLTGINSNWGVRTSLPVKKGDTVSIELNSVTVSYFRFVYAEGEQ